MHEVLEALESLHRTGDTQVFDTCAAPVLIPALRERLAQPKQEPVATVRCINGITIGYLEVMQPVGTKLYTTPPQRKPLTDEEIAAGRRAPWGRGLSLDAFKAGVRFAETTHGIKEKNT